VRRSRIAPPRRVKAERRTLDIVAHGPALRHLVVGDRYPKQQVEATLAAFQGETLWIRGNALRGDTDRSNVDVSWRRPVEQYLSLPATASGRVAATKLRR